MSSASTPLFRGPIATGKWTQKEEKMALQLVKNFLRGKCPDCEQGNPIHQRARSLSNTHAGTSLQIYLATKLNTQPNRIANKFIDKPKLLEVSLWNKLVRHLMNAGEVPDVLYM